MTKEPDYEGALKAAMVVAKQTSGPLRYKVLDNVKQLIAITRTKWTAELLAKALTRADVGLVPFHVEDMDGNELESDEEE
jgi:hypothetical protein